MPAAAPVTPPRPVAPGTVVAAYSEHLDAWTAAQITAVDPAEKTLAVLQLDWSGPEPATVADLGPLIPLEGARGLCHCRYDWVLPRGHKILGPAPVLHDGPVNSYGGWSPGVELYHRRGGGDWDTTHTHTVDAPGLAALLADPAPGPAVRHLTVYGLRDLDCACLAARFPNLTQLRMWGPGTLTGAAALNWLPGLRALQAKDLFGMEAADHPRPEGLPRLESLWLHSVPAAYAAAARAAWKPQIPHGTALTIRAPRRPAWIAENIANPLRDWDGDDQIPAAVYRRAMKQYRATRRAVQDQLVDGVGPAAAAARLVAYAEAYGEEFNRLDEETGFIDTIYREDLYEAVHHIVTEAETALGRKLEWAHDAVQQGVDNVRDW